MYYQFTTGQFIEDRRALFVAMFVLSLLRAEVYGPGGSYNAFTGKDASRAIAKWSMKEEDLNDNLVRIHVNSWPLGKALR